MTMDEPEDEARAGPSTSQVEEGVTPKLGHKYFDTEMCFAPPRKFEKKRIELCNTIMPVLESPMSPPEHKRGPSMDTPLVQPISSNFHASYHVQNTVPYPLECTGKPYLLKAQHSAFNISDSTTIPLTVQNWQITSFVPDSTNKHSTDKQRNFRVPDSTKSSKKLACAL